MFIVTKSHIEFPMLIFSILLCHFYFQPERLHLEGPVTILFGQSGTLHRKCFTPCSHRGYLLDDLPITSLSLYLA